MEEGRVVGWRHLEQFVMWINSSVQVEAYMRTNNSARVKALI